MDIRIPLSLPSGQKTYEEFLMTLNQLELAVHYAQKSVKSAKESGMEITEDSYICFDFPRLSPDTMSNNYEELQEPSIRIVLEAVK